MTEQEYAPGGLVSRGAPVAAMRVLAECEREYVQALNAVLGSRDDSSPDAYRWRGHAEARRQTAEALRAALQLEPVSYTSDEWRDANGVYPVTQVQRWRQQAQAEWNHELRPECPHCGGHLKADT